MRQLTNVEEAQLRSIALLCSNIENTANLLRIGGIERRPGSLVVPTDDALTLLQTLRSLEKGFAGAVPKNTKVKKKSTRTTVAGAVTKHNRI